MGAAASIHHTSESEDAQSTTAIRNRELIIAKCNDKKVSDMYFRYARMESLKGILANDAGTEAFIQFLKVQCAGKSTLFFQVIKPFIHIIVRMRCSPNSSSLFLDIESTTHMLAFIIFGHNDDSLREGISYCLYDFRLHHCCS